MDIKNFLEKNCKITKERAIIIEKSLEKPKEDKELLNQLSDIPKLQKIGLTDVEIKNIRIGLNNYIIFKSSICNFLIDDENKLNIFKETSNNADIAKDEETQWEFFVTFFKTKYPALCVYIPELLNQKELFKKELHNFIKNDEKPFTYGSYFISNLTKSTYEFIQISNLPRNLFDSCLTSLDELYNFYDGFKDYLNISIKSYVIGGSVMFGIMFAYSFQKHFRSWLKNEIDLKLFGKLLVVDGIAYGITTLCSQVSSLIGGFLGLIFGPIGSSIVSFITGAVSMYLSKKYVEPKVRKSLSNWVFNINLTYEELYKKALSTFGVAENAEDYLIKYSFNYEINKLKLSENSSESDVSKFVTYLNAYNTIQIYREQVSKKPLDFTLNS